MEKKKILISAIIILGIVIILILLRGNEDDWIKDSRGVYVKHGNPSSIPDYVTEQQNIITCAKTLYENNKNLELYSQCLGRCGGYSVDIVNVPRNADDNKAENQCSDYRGGITKNFIELDKKGEIIRIV